MICFVSSGHFEILDAIHLSNFWCGASRQHVSAAFFGSFFPFSLVSLDVFSDDAAGFSLEDFVSVFIFFFYGFYVYVSVHTPVV